MSAGQEVGEIFGQGSGPATALLRSPTVIIAGIGLWGMNIYLFRVFGIDYKRTFLVTVTKEKTNTDDDIILLNPEHEHLIELSSSTAASSSASAAALSSAHNSLNDSSSNMSTLSPLCDVNELQGASITGGSNDIDGSRAQPDFTATSLLTLSIALLFLLHVTSFTWIHILGGDAMGAVFCFYALVTAASLHPYSSSSAWARRGLKIVGYRVAELFHPRCYCCSYEIYRPIPFIDVFFADALCSLSKVFFDWGMLWHMASHYPDPVPASAHSIIIPSVCAALPYIIRARQCMVMHTVGVLKSDPKRYQHVLNAVKYCSSLFPICLSAYQKTVVTANEPAKAAVLEAILIVLLVINCCYCFTWDVTMDWGMISDPAALLSEPIRHLKEPKLCFQKLLRPRLRFGSKISLAILITNLFLRFTWLLRFWEKRLFSSVDEFVLCTEFLEVFRRALWNLLRVEWEQLKITTHKQQQLKRIGSAQAMMMMNIDEDEDDYFAKENASSATNGIINHNVNNNNGLTVFPFVPSRRMLSLPNVN